ncbi:MAG: hypothetical protein ACXAC7_03790 [Candidatus Hodarchaeales archaeon]
MKRYCTNCGELESDSNAKFCARCGNKFKLKKNMNNIKQSSDSAMIIDNYQIQKTKSNIQIIAVLEIVLGSLILLGSIFIFWIVRMIRHGGHRQMFEFRETYQSHAYTNFAINIVGIIGLFLLIYGLISIVSGVGLLKNKKWAKTSSMVIGAIAIVSVPLGTLFGFGSLYVLTRPEVEIILTSK